MKNLLFLVVFSVSSLFAANSDFTVPKALITSAVNVTSVWSVVGFIKNPGLNGDSVFDSIGLIADLDINAASNVRIRARYSDTSTGTKYSYMIKTVGSSDVKLEDSYYEFNDDADGYYIFDIPVLPFNYIHIETSAGTEGATKAQLDALKYYFSK